MRQWMAWIGAAVAIVCAPFVALADGLVVDPLLADAPRWALDLHDIAGPLVEFSSPPVAMRVWQLPMAVGVLFALSQGGGIAWGLTAERNTRLALSAALAATGAASLGALLESLTSAETMGENVGFALYFVGIPVALIATSVLGVVSLREKTLPRSYGLALALSPLAVVVFSLVLLQFPAGQLPIFALFWAILTGARRRLA